MRSSLLAVGRRYAAGIDVGQNEVRAIVLSRRLFGAAQLRVEHVGRAPLSADAVAGAQWVDPQAVATALMQVLAPMPPCRSARLAGYGPPRALRCAMALPPSATIVGRAPLAALARQAGMPVDGIVADGLVANEVMANAGLDGSLNALESGVLLEAERLAGMERSALAVDWYIAEPQAQQEQVAIVTTPRQHIETRVEVAAAAGIALSAIEGEPAAALRACRYAAASELEPDEAYSVLWVGVDGMCGWHVDAGSVRRAWLYPRAGAEQASLADALHAFARGRERSCVFVAGALSLLPDAGLTIERLGEVLECIALPFELMSLDVSAAGAAAHQAEPAAFAVAFGLALREVRK